MTTAALRPRSAPELIDAVVIVLRRHYLELLTVAVLYTVFIVIGVTLPLLAVQFGVLPGRGSLVLAALGSIWVVLFVVFIAMNDATTTVIIAGAYLGRPVSIAAAVRRALRRCWPAAILTGLRLAAILIGTLLLLVPGLLCALWFFAGINVLMIEGGGPVEALRRSRELTRGSLGRIFGVLALCAMIVVIIRLVVVLILVLLVPQLHAGSPTTSLISNGVGFLLYPFLVAATTVLYFDLRIRKEGLDIELTAGDIERGLHG